MKNLKPSVTEKKIGLHPRNRHASRYDFAELIKSSPELKPFVATNKFNEESIDFANPEAVKSLNRALLKHFYEVHSWDVPKDYLCPPIPGRADTIHLVADLLSSKNKGIIPKGNQIRVLDIGVGANCVYPLIATFEYGWSVTGSDIDATALKNAQQIIEMNELDSLIELRLQSAPNAIFSGIIKKDEFFDLCISNPPFHASAEEAMEGSQRKVKNLGRYKRPAKGPTIDKRNEKRNVLNFGGQNNELWCEGGEVAFISRMIAESQAFKSQCFWFTSIVSKAASLPFLYEELKKYNVQDFKTIDMAQGHKKSRILAWTFFTPAEHHEWRNKLTIP